MEATPLWVNPDGLVFGSDIFNLVILLSRVKQLAFLFVTTLRSPADHAFPCEPLEPALLPD